MLRRTVLVAVVCLVSLGTTSHAQDMASAARTEAASVESAAIVTVPGAAKPASHIVIPRFEIGTQTTMLRTPANRRGCGGCPVPQFAVGPAITLNLNRNFALDGSASFFLSSSMPMANYGGRLSEALAGVKASLHGRRWTLFAKARPGVVSASRTVTQIEFAAIPPLSQRDLRAVVGRTNSFALDLGGGLEYRVAPKVALRTELGETFIRLTSPRFGSVTGPARFVHNVQASTGVYYRFGRTIATEVTASEQPHRFFDRSNLMLMALSVLAQASDAITTQRAFADCHRAYAVARVPTSYCADIETDPIARPFVSHGWSGQLGLGAIVNSAQMLAMYGIHRMGHHRIERVVPIPLAIASAYMAYSNRQQK